MDGRDVGKETLGDIFQRFFEPRAVAILGSFREGHFGGYVIIKSLLRAGYKGAIYPVNPGYREVQGLAVYPSLESLPGECDLAIIMINARSVIPVIRQCAAKGIRAAIVVADGFAERDREGALRQQELVETARALGVRIIGPNTAGVLNTANGFNPCPYEAGYYRVRQGPIALCAQTGMINPQAFPYPSLGFGVSKLCDMGNKCDLNECDLLEYLGQDPSTGVVSLYLESIREGARFLEVAGRVTSQKPVLLIKSGRTGEGARASASHTGSMAADDRIFDGACRQAGILRLDEFQEIFEMPKIFAAQPLPSGNRLGIVTVTGGVAVMAIDAGAKYDLRLHPLGGSARDMLNGLFPGTGNMPVDIGPMMAAVKDAFSLFPKILEAVMGDDNVDLLFNVLWANPEEAVRARYVEIYEKLRGRYPKPVATWIYGPSAEAREELAERLEGIGFPVFQSPESAIKALGLLWRYRKHQAERAGSSFGGS